MILILEGCDGTGKTWLARELEREHGFTRIHQGPFEDDPLLESLVAVSRGLERGPKLVCDRLHLGERIYGPILRGEDKLGAEKQRMLERVLLSLNTLLVTTNPPWGRVEHEWSSRVDDELVKDSSQVRQIYDWYQGEISMLPRVEFDWTQHTVEDLVSCLGWASPINGGPGIGWWGPSSTLIVGEQCNASTPGPLLPFVGTGGSSLWLAQQLEGVDERLLYWVNARSPDGQDEDPRFIEELEPNGIIALGAVASSWLRKAGYEHVRLDHPQYHKRFYFHQRYPLAEKINEIRSSNS